MLRAVDTGCAAREGSACIRGGLRPEWGVRPAGIEPAACGLKDRCSLAPRREPLTTELRARAVDVYPTRRSDEHLILSTPAPLARRRASTSPTTRPDGGRRVALRYGARSTIAFAGSLARGTPRPPHSLTQGTYVGRKPSSCGIVTIR